MEPRSHNDLAGNHFVCALLSAGTMGGGRKDASTKGPQVCKEEPTAEPHDRLGSIRRGPYSVAREQSNSFREWDAHVSANRS